MAQYIDLRTLKFLLHDVHGTETLQAIPYFQDYDAEAYDMSLDAAKALSDAHLYPIYREMDQNKAYYEDGVVRVHPKLKSAIDALGEGGWLSAPYPYEDNGQQMPLFLKSAVALIFYAANGNAASYAFLTEGAANLIRNFGAEELKRTYMDRMFSGEWQGTMALTEPQAGSSLSDITTTAVPQPDGSYKITGQKIYISGGDYESATNVVHLTLARIEGSAAGTKGISLFVVPKYRVDGNELVDNDVTTAGIYGKMGQKGYVAAHLMMGERLGGATGYLVGQAHRGLKYMFQMMNEARIGTGLMAAGTACAAYYASLQYAKERPQGRHPSNKDVNHPQVLIIEHADVKRMLLYQKSIVEGSFSLLLYCSKLADIAEQSTDAKVKEEAHLKLELLTPVAKSFPAEFGTLAVSTGMQVLGGAGYTDDFPLEQYYRDIRVNAIYEGTTTIHGMDILGRKVMLGGGKALQLLGAEIQQTITTALGMPRLEAHAKALGKTAQQLQETTMHLMGLAQSERPEVFLADATLYLEFFGIVTVAWQWLTMGIAAVKTGETDPKEVASFYAGKLTAMDYYFEYELVKTIGLRKRLLSERRVTLEVGVGVID